MTDEAHDQPEAHPAIRLRPQRRPLRARRGTWPSPSRRPRATVLSAGTTPAETPSAGTIASLAEVGIDDTAHVPTQLTEELVRQATVVVARKPGLSIPEVDGVTYDTWDLPNAQGWEAPAIRPLRQHISKQVADLLDRVSS